jgi:hypothetical protein
MYLQNKVFTYPFLAVHLFHPQLTTGIRVSNIVVLLISTNNIAIGLIRVCRIRFQPI